jgi:hypothetical protein
LVTGSESDKPEEDFHLSDIVPSRAHWERLSSRDKNGTLSFQSRLKAAPTNQSGLLKKTLKFL